MPRIPLRDIKPGQSLARPITNANGVVLVQAGTELTPRCCAKGLGYPGGTVLPRINQEAWSLLGLAMEDVAAVCAALDDDAERDAFS